MNTATVDYASPTPNEGVATPRFVLGILLLGVAVTMTVILVMGHFDATAMPGCGKGAGCAEAAASKWGKLTLGEFIWPVSFLGFAYFSGLFIAWLTCRRGIPTAFRWAVRLGVLVSLFFIGIIFTKQLICYYCLGAHVSNLLFWILLETNRRTVRTPNWKPVGALAAIFLLASGSLAVADYNARQKVEGEQNAMFEETQSELARNTERQRQQMEAKRAAAAEEAARLAALNANNPDNDKSGNAKPKDPNAKPWTGPFTGRYRMGPEKARVRIVMITDYQCPDCKRIEGEVVKWVKANDKDVSLSTKHFPMCADCNPNFANYNMHPNACWAARAAEAAGMLGGNAGFWQMHEWLFSQSGSFTDATLPTALAEMGYDPQEFVRTMMSDATLANVKSDIDEAIWLGLHFTPMVFINGVEMKGIFAHNAVVRAAQTVLNQKPERMGPEFDDPDTGAMKCVTDWAEQSRRPLTPDRQAWWTGPDNAKVRVEIFADYQEPGSKECDAAIRAWLKGKQNVSYNFRHFPVDESCNEVTTKTQYPKSCIGHRATEAAGQLAGKDEYWKMHDYVYAHQADLSVDGVVAQATAQGLNADAFKAKMNSPEVTAAINDDAKSAKPTKETTNMGQIRLYRGGIPTVYVNDKVVPRWKLKDDVVIDDILDRAYAE